MNRGPYVKICGVTSVDDAKMCVEHGAHAIGLNFVAGSPRCVTIATAQAIAQAAKACNPSTIVVGVVANQCVSDLIALKANAALDCLQLHGDERPADLTPLLPHAYKAIRIASAADVALARSFAGEYLLVDAKVDGQLGGSGMTFDWSLVKALSSERKLTLAGGLTPQNVRQAIAAVQPYCVDVASGVEFDGRPGIKDPAKVRAFTHQVCCTTH